jgi:ribosomal protein L21E
MTYQVGDEVRVKLASSANQRRETREHDGELGVIQEILGATPTYRVAFGHGRDAFLCENSLARTK